ncbi:DUF4367 domain-containing protein [Clostridium sp. Mt-5]|uniref:DUF4367 domain-containing protein n=1 Tax=Clostridium moutaii TaxID=3240932 RepID=A0ABV4BRM1_9CLOT
MKDNINNLKEIVDSALDDIYVTEELKNKTFIKCKNKNLKPLFIKGLSIATVTFTILGYYYFYAKNNTVAETSIKTLNKLIKVPIHNNYAPLPAKKNNINSIDNKIHPNDKIANSKSDFNTKDNYNSSSVNASEPPVSISPNKSEVKDTNIESKSQSFIINNKISKENDTSNISISPSLNEKIFELNLKPSNMLDLATVQNYFGSNVSLPSYVPEGFKLDSMVVPQNAEEEKIIDIKYTNADDKYFNLIQSKKLSPNISGEKIDINETTGYISTEDIIKITWIKNNIQYTLYGNISKDSIISIAKSIN